MELIQWGELLTLSLMGIALGMDAFSLSIGMGMRGIRLLHIAKVSLVNGLFHMLMPLLGMVLGKQLSNYIGHIAVSLGGIILIFFGIQMIYSSIFGKEKETWISPTSWGLLLFSFGVSLDAFSIGISFGFLHIPVALAVLCIGIASFVMTAIGLQLGRKVGPWLGSYSEAIGGMILLVFGIKFLV